MHSPTVDIIVPVWNSAFETRACLSAILAHSPDCRLIVIDNGSNRETQIMLEEFSEPLGEKALFLASQRNLGLVPAINLGLASADRDYAVIIRPHVIVTEGWLTALKTMAAPADIGIVSPLLTGCCEKPQFKATAGCRLIETFDISFNALLLKKEMALWPEGFNEEMDGGEWCLKDFTRRAWARGYRTALTSTSKVICGKEAVFGSEKRRQEMLLISRNKYRECWGNNRHYTVYFGKAAPAEALQEAMETIINSARHGNRFSLLLHRQQHILSAKKGWNCLHTGIEVIRLSALLTERDFSRRIRDIKAKETETVLVRGTENVVFPGADTTISFSLLAEDIKK